MSEMRQIGGARMSGIQRQRSSKRIMRRINYFAAVLALHTLAYAALVILNPFNYLGDGDGERLFAIAYIAVAYPGKAAAIQLIGTALIAFGIIISQENLIARMVSLTGATFVWIGLLQGTFGNPSLVNTTLIIFLVSAPLQAAVVGAYMLTPRVFRLIRRLTIALIRFANGVRQWAVYRMRAMRNRSGIWLRSVWQTTRRLWPF